jgi:hypothetical protein
LPERLISLLQLLDTASRKNSVCFEVDDKVELGRLSHREFGELFRERGRVVGGGSILSVAAARHLVSLRLARMVKLKSQAAAPIASVTVRVGDRPGMLTNAIQSGGDMAD